MMRGPSFGATQPCLRPKNKRCLPKSSVLICYKHKPRIDIALRLGGTRASLKSTTQEAGYQRCEGQEKHGFFGSSASRKA